jgi:hypothetical protein
MDDSDAVADAYYHGVIWYYIGCGDGTEIVKFRVNREETVLEVWDAATRKFVAPGVWLQSYLASQN